MPLDLSQLATRIRDYRGRMVTNRGEMTSEFKQLFYSLANESNEVVDTAQTAADTAQAAADSAANSAASASQSSGYLDFPDGRQVEWTDVGAGYPAGDPFVDLTVNARDKDGVQVAQIVIRGQLTTATGLITLTEESSSADPTYTIGELFAGSGSMLATATITATFPDSSQIVGTLSWQSRDYSTEGEFVSF